MIKANELRIGNWVMYDNRLFQIESISNPFPCLNTDEFGIGVVDWNNIQPIPLTPEILENFGFENWDKKKYSNDVLCLTVNGDGYLYLANQRHVNIFYLHQLQNLYFALTGEELTYNP